jgi:uncharacterized protein YyaL (SSP411 family)
VLIFRPDGAAAREITALAEHVEAQRPIQGRATAYVCENCVCRQPTTSVEELVRLLESGPDW